MTPNERAILVKLLAVRHPTTPQTNRFRLRKATNTDFTGAVESRGQAAFPPKKTGTLEAFGDDLKPIAGNDAGGMLVEWTAGSKQRPIIFLSSEGEIQIAAAHVMELFGMLAHCGEGGWDFWEAMDYATWELTALDIEKAARPAPPVIEGPQAPLDEEVAALLAANDVPVVKDVLGRARAAARTYLWPFIDRIDTIVTGYKAQRPWYDAWNQPGADVATARPFSPEGALHGRRAADVRPQGREPRTATRGRDRAPEARSRAVRRSQLHVPARVELTGGRHQHLAHEVVDRARRVAGDARTSPVVKSPKPFV